MRHASLWYLTGASLAFGVLLLVGGSSAGSDIGSLAAGYGSLIIGSALFLGAGLAIRALIGRSGAQPRTKSAAPSSTIQGHHFF
ncbi:MAG: hypothetical protein ABI978_07775 [Chloroflexota bacterium]